MEDKKYSNVLWRDTFYRISICFVISVFIIEMLIFILNGKDSIIEQSLPVYLFYYVFLPCIINIIAVLTVRFLRRLKDIDEFVLNMAHVISIVFICTVVAWVHFIFPITLMVFIIPVFLTAFWGNKELCSKSVFISFAGLLIDAVHSLIVNGNDSTDKYFLINIGIAFIVYFMVSAVSVMLTRVLQKQHDALVNDKMEANEANEAKSSFLANTSHEIRTPINTVIGMNEMILRESKSLDIKKYAMDVNSAAKSLLLLINDILDLSKIESGKMEIIPVEYDTAAMLNDIVNMIKAYAKPKGLDFVLNIDSQLPAVLYGDDIRLRQVIINILTNAVKYTPKGSVTFTVGGEVKEDIINLKVKVQDTGIGIKKDDLKKLFVKFERIEESRNRNIEGTGLGMSITTQLLKMMGSSLEVESTYGEGTTFWFNIVQRIVKREPMGDLQERMRENAKEYKYSETFTMPDADILLVDDNRLNRRVFTSLLKKTEVKIDEAANGIECLGKTSKKKYDLIFLDHMMPDMDGLETFAILKNDKIGINYKTPVVILTANAITGAKESYLEEGFAGYLSKPIDTKELEHMLCDLLPDKVVDVNN